MHFARKENYVCISSVQDWIPANYIFKPETIWEGIYIGRKFFECNFQTRKGRYT